MNLHRQIKINMNTNLVQLYKHASLKTGEAYTSDKIVKVIESYEISYRESYRKL